MDPKWFPDSNRDFSNPVGAILTAFIVQIFSNLLPTPAYRFVLAMPIFLYCVIHTRKYAATGAAENYLAMINLVTLVLRWLEMSVLRQPWVEFWKVNSPVTKRDRSINQGSLAQRLMWSLGLCTTNRGIGWNWRVKNVDSLPVGTSRSNFVFRQLLKCARSYLIIDFISYCLAQIFPNPYVPDVFALSSINQILVGWLMVVRSVSEMNIPYALCAVLAVSTHLSKPEDWPPAFGRWSEAYTMRKGWGYCWHQFLRRTLEVYPDIVARWMGLQSGTLLNRYFRLYSAFFLSGLIHHCGSLNVQWTQGVKYHLAFFLVQPVFITFEDLAVHIGKQFGLRKNGFTYLLGYAWVGFVLSLSLPWFAKSGFDYFTLDGGLPKKHPLIPFSIAERVLGSV